MADYTITPGTQDDTWGDTLNGFLADIDARLSALEAAAAGVVLSVNGQTGDVVLTTTDLGAADAVHTHVQADVTNLVSDLAGKAASSHTHAQADVTNLVSNLAAKAPLASPTFTGTVAGITKSMVGLGSVDNTADADKPVSTAQQTALDLKSDDGHTHVSSDITDVSFSDFAQDATCLKYLKYDSGTSTYPNRSQATSDPDEVVVWWGGPGPTKTGTGSTGAVTDDGYAG